MLSMTASQCLMVVNVVNVINGLLISVAKVVVNMLILSTLSTLTFFLTSSNGRMVNVGVNYLLIFVNVTGVCKINGVLIVVT